jgi:hypothetical protein
MVSPPTIRAAGEGQMSFGGSFGNFGGGVHQARVTKCKYCGKKNLAFQFDGRCLDCVDVYNKFQRDSIKGIATLFGAHRSEQREKKE